MFSCAVCPGSDGAWFCTGSRTAALSRLGWQSWAQHLLFVATQNKAAAEKGFSRFFQKGSDGGPGGVISAGSVGWRGCPAPLQPAPAVYKHTCVSSPTAKHLLFAVVPKSALPSASAPLAKFRNVSRAPAAGHCGFRIARNLWKMP